MDVDVQALISGDSDKVAISLQNFLKKSSQSFGFPELNQNNYRKDLWKSLYNIIQNPKCEHIYVDCLAAIRILSRDKTEINELINEDFMDAIIYLAALKNDTNFEDRRTYNVALESLKCMCNLIFNSSVAAAISCKNGTLEGIIRRLRTYRDPKLPAEIKFFDMKVLFLITALCSEVRPRLKEELHGVTYLIETLDLILKENAERNHNSDVLEAAAYQNTLMDLQVDLSCEILKVLFNLTLRDINNQVDEEEEAHYLRLIAILHDYLIVNVLNVEKKHELDNHVINLLTNMPNSCLQSLATQIQEGQNLPKDLQFEEYNMAAIGGILNFLTQKFSNEAMNSSQNEALYPVLTTLLKCAKSFRMIRKYLRMQILPPLRDVHTRPEQGNTLRNHLCRLLTSPITPLKNLSAELLFVLCKENVNRMIKYTGYGNAAGLFAARGLLGGRDGDKSEYSSDSDDSDTEEYKELKHGINPVVGCYEPPRPNPTAHMTEEQKEFEAMNLVDLIDKLTRTGVVKPCKVGEDGRPEPIEHVLQLQENLQDQQIHMDDDSD